MGGDDILAEAWKTKFPGEAIAYAKQLMSIADKYAAKHNLQYLKEERLLPDDVDEDGLEHKIHILYSAARWLIFYGERGHGYEADY